MRDTNSHTATVSRPLVWLFACAAALSVANVYYAQPLLDTLAQEFGMLPSSSGMVITATQAGCALALLLVVPLGDMLNRRRLTLLQLGLLGISLAALACATSTAALLAGMLLARIDGKSPVEYITTDAQRDRVRRFAIPLLLQPARRLSEIRQRWSAA